MKSSVSSKMKRGGITGQSDPKHASIHGNLTPLDPYISSIGSKTRRNKESHTRHAGHRSYEIRLSGMMSMGLLISHSLRTYTTIIGIWRGSIPMYASMFWVTLAGDSTSFRCGEHTGFHDSHMIYVC